VSKDIPKDKELRSNYVPYTGEKEDKTPETPTNIENNDTVTKANFSALLYVVTEQQALIGRLLEVLLANGVLSAAQLERVTDIYGDENTLQPVYADVYKRFAWYFMATKELIEANEPCPHGMGEDLAKNSPEDPDNE